MKRQLEDEVADDEDREESKQQKETGSFPRASESVLAGRKFVTARRQHAAGEGGDGKSGGLGLFPGLVAPPKPATDKPIPTAGTDAAAAAEKEDPKTGKTSDASAPDATTAGTANGQISPGETADTTRNQATTNSEPGRKPPMEDLTTADTSESKSPEEGTIAKEGDENARKRQKRPDPTQENNADKPAMAASAGEADAEAKPVDPKQVEPEVPGPKETDEKNMDAKETDEKNMDAKETDEKNVDAKETDEKNMDAKETDEKSMDAKGTKEKNMDAKETDEKNEDAKETDEKAPATGADKAAAASGETAAGETRTAETKKEAPPFTFGKQAAPLPFGTSGNPSLFKASQAFTFSGVAAESKPFAFPSSDGAKFTFPAQPAFPSSTTTTGLSSSGSGSASGGGASLFQAAATTNSQPSATAPAQPPEVPVSSGEEMEVEEFRRKARLFELDTVNDKTQWTERGSGDLKLNVHRETRRGRLIMRTDGTLRLILNTSLWRDFKLDKANERTARFCSFNADRKISNYLVKFPIKDDLDRLSLAVDKWREGAPE